MDLIYASTEREDVGVFTSYTLDLAYGEDENSFLLTVPVEFHCCGHGFLVYREGSEDGGIVDKVAVDTEKGTVTYGGRTWHGILTGKVLCPDAGEDYLVVSGEANTVLGNLIRRVGLTGSFAADSGDSGITVAPYQFKRYTDAYTGIREMLGEADAKLRIRYGDRLVTLSAVPRNAYVWSGDVDSSQASFRASHDYRPVNHLVCLGGGELAGRAVIHLFTDENGGIQPYSTVDDPVQDSDYITDESRKVLDGEDEVAEVLDYPSSEVTRNYIPLPAEPLGWEALCTECYQVSGDGYAPVTRRTVTEYLLQKYAPIDWGVNCGAYYKKSGTDFVRVTTAASYTALAAEPSDWDDGYDGYYLLSGGSYTRVSGVRSEQYVLQTGKPKDWGKRWSSYYFVFTDGVTTEYRRVDGISHDKYLLQTVQPTDWAEHYARYYQRVKAGGYETAKAVKGNTPSWRPKAYFTKKSYETAPTWESGTYYTFVSSTVAPAWSSGTYYEKDDDTAPTWERNKYYTKVTSDKAPRFSTGTFFVQVTDRYEVLVKAGIERLRQLWQADELVLNASAVGAKYDIGDIVTASDNGTGISVTQEVVKKIVRVTSGEDSEEYILR